MIHCKQLNESQYQDVKKLTELCEQTDGGSPMIHYHLLSQKRDTNNNILYYKDGYLLGFLSVYFFYEKACEMSLLVAPTHRRQGIATLLIQAMLPLLHAKNMAEVTVSTTPSLSNTWLPSIGFSYKNSGYHMERNSFEAVLTHNDYLAVRKAIKSDLSKLYILDVAGFSDNQTNMLERLIYLLNHNDYTIFLAFHNNLAIGKAHIHWQLETALLSDITILPKYQGKGFGSELLAYCINYVLNLGKIKLALDVEAKNKDALSLYSRFGFKIITDHDYWAIPVEKLQRILPTIFGSVDNWYQVSKPG